MPSPRLLSQAPFQRSFKCPVAHLDLLKHVEVKTVPKFLQREKEADKSAEQFQDFQGMCTAAPAQRKM